jgi:hypothetical protein
LIGSKDISPIPAIPARKRIADFEAERTLLDTLPVNSTDPGQDHSRMLFGRILRTEGGHAMSIAGRMAEIDSPYARLNLPLSPAAIEPVDASRFKGIEFEARGEGEYRLVIPSRAVRDERYYAARFHASGKWSKVRVRFSDLRQPPTKSPVPWTAADLVMLTFEIARPPGEWAWLELDNVRFY